MDEGFNEIGGAGGGSGHDLVALVRTEIRFDRLGRKICAIVEKM